MSSGLDMLRDMDIPVPQFTIPDGYSVIAVNEENGHLWDEVMDSSWGNHPPGSFLYVMVSNNGYEDNRVFVTQLVRVFTGFFEIHGCLKRFFAILLVKAYRDPGF